MNTTTTIAKGVRAAMNALIAAEMKANNLTATKAFDKIVSTEPGRRIWSLCKAESAHSGANQNSLEGFGDRADDNELQRLRVAHGRKGLDNFNAHVDALMAGDKSLSRVCDGSRPARTSRVVGASEGMTKAFRRLLTGEPPKKRKTAPLHVVNEGGHNRAHPAALADLERRRALAAMYPPTANELLLGDRPSWRARAN
jgi:hypothetical protein